MSLAGGRSALLERLADLHAAASDQRIAARAVLMARAFLGDELLAAEEARGADGLLALLGEAGIAGAMAEECVGVSGQVSARLSWLVDSGDAAPYRALAEQVARLEVAAYAARTANELAAMRVGSELHRLRPMLGESAWAALVADLEALFGGEREIDLALTLSRLHGDLESGIVTEEDAELYLAKRRIGEGAA